MLTLKDALVFGRIFTEIKKNVLRFHFIQNENKFIILVCMTTVSPVTSFKEQKNLEYALSSGYKHLMKHLILTTSPCSIFTKVSQYLNSKD